MPLALVRRPPYSRYGRRRGHRRCRSRILPWAHGRGALRLLLSLPTPIDWSRPSGLELLVAGDIIRTVAIAPTFNSVGVLAVIVAIRTFLSFSLEVELTGTVMSSTDPAAWSESVRRIPSNGRRGWPAQVNRPAGRIDTVGETAPARRGRRFLDRTERPRDRRQPRSRSRVRAPPRSARRGRHRYGMGRGGRG